MAPQFMALLQVLFEPLERVSKLAMFGVIGGLAAIIGPILGGVLIEADILGLGWRIIFLINLPIGILAIVSARLFLPDTRSARPAGYDLAGMALFGAAVAAALWPLMRVTEAGWGWLELASLLAAVPLCLAGWRHVGRLVAAKRAALFDPSLFAVRSFSLGLAISISFAAANAGFLLVFAFALQAERAQTPLVTGLLHMPFGFGVMFGIGFLGRRFLPTMGRWIMVAGALIMAAGGAAVLLGIGVLALSWLALTPLLIVAGIGMGMISGCIPPVTVAQIDRDHAGAASALLKTCQQLGSALGVACAGGIYFTVAADDGMPPSQAALLLIVAMLLVCAALAARLPTDIFAARPAPPGL